MKTKVFFLSTIFTVISLITVAQNEKRFAFEISIGPSFATQKLAGADLNTGLGFEGDFQYRFMEHVSVYAGWGGNKFSAKESFAGNDMDFEETGYIIGLEFKHPVGNSGISLFGRGGALYNHIEIENEEGDILHDTGHGWGWQAAAGADIPLGKNWSLTPGVKFNSLNRDLEISDINYDLQQNYISARIGFIKRF
ncbi:MAG TPA: outer membrane beta-barrel protein [Lentimicrobium sp.]|nr:outer membrane beta-barrel protein [Lentimicrobium sp.]